MAVHTLVVEDDTFTRVTLTESLRAQGVDVVLATDRAAEALEVARSRPVHAAFLDLHLGAGPTALSGGDWTLEARPEGGSRLLLRIPAG